MMASSSNACPPKLKTQSSVMSPYFSAKNGILAISRMAPHATRPNWYTRKRVNCVAPASPTFMPHLVRR